MKTKLGLFLAGLCASVATIVMGEEFRAASPSSTSSADSAPALTLAEAQKTIAAARRYVAHPSPEEKETERRAEPRVTSPDFEIAQPPPAPRPETKPTQPVTGYVWVPGHYMPLKGEWRWVKGEWAVPATPASVWIPARYDEQEKKWSPGYWQPDRPAAPEATSETQREAGSSANRAPPKSSGY